MVKKREISLEIRKLIINHHNNGLSYKKISEIVQINKNTIASIVQRYKRTGIIVNSQGRGRKKKTTARIDRAILNKVKANRRISAVKVVSEIRNEFGLEIHPQLVRNRLRAKEFAGKLAVKKPWISDKNKKIRMKWAEEKITWTIEDWKRVIWSDESKVQLFGAGGAIRVWRKSGERLKKECLGPTVKHGGGRVMIWGAMGWSGCGQLQFIDGIMTKEKYLFILQENLFASARKLGIEDKFIFQHDGDPKHTAKIVKKWLEEKGVGVLEWPAQSPDLNPIEHLWFILKKKNISEQNPKNLNELKAVITRKWEEIGSDVTQKLIKSMPKRCAAVLRSKGGHTKY